MHIIPLHSLNLEIDKKSGKCAYCKQDLTVAQDYYLYFCTSCDVDYEITWDKGFKIKTVSYGIKRAVVIYILGLDAEIMFGKKRIIISTDYIKDKSLKEIHDKINMLILFS